MAKAIEGENLNVILGSRPYDADSDEKDLVKLNVMAVLNEKYGICEGTSFRLSSALSRLSSQEISVLTEA